MTDLVAWLTKILDEDEARVHDGMSAPDLSGEKPTFYNIDAGTYRDDWGLYTFHVAPERVLADIAAKRALIAEYVARDIDADLMLGPDCLRQREWSGLRLAVQITATVYADRPGYRDEWKPLTMRVHP